LCHWYINRIQAYSARTAQWTGSAQQNANLKVGSIYSF
jgi:hypothetical protein